VDQSINGRFFHEGDKTRILRLPIKTTNLLAVQAMSDTGVLQCELTDGQTVYQHVAIRLDDLTTIVPGMVIAHRMVPCLNSKCYFKQQRYQELYAAWFRKHLTFLSWVNFVALFRASVNTKTKIESWELSLNVMFHPSWVNFDSLTETMIEPRLYASDWSKLLAWNDEQDRFLFLRSIGCKNQLVWKKLLTDLSATIGWDWIESSNAINNFRAIPFKVRQCIPELIRSANKLEKYDDLLKVLPTFSVPMRLWLLSDPIVDKLCATNAQLERAANISSSDIRFLFAAEHDKSMSPMLATTILLASSSVQRLLTTALGSVEAWLFPSILAVYKDGVVRQSNSTTGDTDELSALQTSIDRILIETRMNYFVVHPLLSPRYESHRALLANEQKLDAAYKSKSSSTALAAVLAATPVTSFTNLLCLDGCTLEDQVAWNRKLQQATNRQGMAEWLMSCTVTVDNKDTKRCGFQWNVIDKLLNKYQQIETVDALATLLKPYLAIAVRSDDPDEYGTSLRLRELCDISRVRLQVLLKIANDSKPLWSALKQCVTLPTVDLAMDADLLPPTNLLRLMYMDRWSWPKVKLSQRIWESIFALPGALAWVESWDDPTKRSYLQPEQDERGQWTFTDLQKAWRVTVIAWARETCGVDYSDGHTYEAMMDKREQCLAEQNPFLANQYRSIRARDYETERLQAILGAAQQLNEDLAVMITSFT